MTFPHCKKLCSAIYRHWSKMNCDRWLLFRAPWSDTSHLIIILLTVGGPAEHLVKSHKCYYNAFHISHPAGDCREQSIAVSCAICRSLIGNRHGLLSSACGQHASPFIHSITQHALLTMTNKQNILCELNSLQWLHYNGHCWYYSNTSNSLQRCLDFKVCWFLYIYVK